MKSFQWFVVLALLVFTLDQSTIPIEAAKLPVVAKFLNASMNGDCASAAGLAFNSRTGVLFVGCSGPGTVLAVNASKFFASNFPVLRRWPTTICSGIMGVAVDAANNVVYAACYGNSNTASGSVIRLDGSNMLAPHSTFFAGCAHPVAVAVVNTTGAVVVACYYGGYGEHNVFSVAAGGGAVTSLTSSCLYANGVAYHSTSNRVFATCYQAQVITMNLDGSDPVIFAASSSCPYPKSIAIANANSILLSCNTFSDSLPAMINAAADGTVRNVLIANRSVCKPSFIEVADLDSNTSIVFVSCGSALRVSFVISELHACRILTAL